MKSPRIFATIMFVCSDQSSGVDKQDLEYDSAVSVKAYIDFFLEQTKNKHAAQKATLFSLELSEHDKNGDYLLDQFNEIKKRPIQFHISDRKSSKLHA